MELVDMNWLQKSADGFLDEPWDVAEADRKRDEIFRGMVGVKPQPKPKPEHQITAPIEEPQITTKSDNRIVLALNQMIHKSDSLLKQKGYSTTAHRAEAIKAVDGWRGYIQCDMSYITSKQRLFYTLIIGFSYFKTANIFQGELNWNNNAPQSKKFTLTAAPTTAIDLMVDQAVAWADRIKQDPLNVP